MQQNAGPSRVTAVPLSNGDHNDDLLRAVQDAAAGSHEVLGEMGRDANGRIIYLARDLKSAGLVALRLDGAQGDYVLDVARTLDASVGRAVSAACDRCGAPLVRWGKFCPQCGADVAQAVTESGSREDLLDAVKAAARDEFEILGEMDHAEGGGVVYFARELASGNVVTLRLRKEPDASETTKSYSLGETRVLRPLVDAIGAASDPPQTAPPVEAPAPRVPPVPTLGKPMMPRLTPQEVLIPADQVPVDETLPPRPARPIPPWMIAGGVVALVAVLAAAMFVHARLTAPDATRMDSVATQAGQGPLALPPIDTAHVMVGGRVPPGTRLTVNGIVWQPPAIALPPGTYTLGAEVVGAAPVTETVSLKAGQTLLWSPALSASRDRSARAVVVNRPQPRKETPRVETRSTKKPAPPATATATVVSATAAPGASATCSSAYGAKDWATALVVCTRDAQSGDLNAQRNLGAMYLQGYGVSRDPTQAFTWFKKAADAGSRDAAYQLALMYEAGRGVPRDATQSTSWYRKAAALGDVDAQVKVGMAYENGSGVDTDMDQAVSWYRKAAEQGSAWAQNRLGWLYGMGKGVDRDDAQAMRYFRGAADQGDPQAEFNVGFMFANGRGVARDDSQAVAWFRKAAAQGYADAQKELKRRGLTQ